MICVPKPPPCEYPGDTLCSFCEPWPVPSSIEVTIGDETQTAVCCTCKKLAIGYWTKDNQFGFYCEEHAP